MNVAVRKKNPTEVDEQNREVSLFCFLSVAPLIYLFIFKSTELKGSQQVSRDWFGGPAVRTARNSPPQSDQ